MSVRHSLLALLKDEPRYGYQLRAEFEATTSSAWPLNIGQVYTTLNRLERDGLVSAAGLSDKGHAFYNITEEGRAEVERWFSTPIDRSSPPRDELAIKLAIAVTVPDVDVRAVIQTQRSATMRALQEYTRLKARTANPENPTDLAWLLVVDSLIFAAEAEVRWLDHCESRLARAAGTRARPATATEPSTSDEEYLAAQHTPVPGASGQANPTTVETEATA